MGLIGNKKTFGIEYHITDKLRSTGYSKIWFGGFSLGTSEDLIYLKSYLISGLEEIENSNTLKLDYNNKKGIYDYFVKKMANTQDNDILKFAVRSFGTFCDDFNIFSFLNQHDEINIVWKLRSNNTPFYDLNNQTMRINHFKINKAEYTKILNKIRDRISKKHYYT